MKPKQRDDTEIVADEGMDQVRKIAKAEAKRRRINY